MARDVTGRSPVRDALPGELERRIVHASGVLVPGAYLADVVSWEQVVVLYLLGTAVTILLECLRLVVGVDWRVFRELTREYEAGNPAGYALYVVSSTIVVLAFAPRIAVPALLMLALVDPVSGLLSRNEFGEPKRPAVQAVTFVLAAVLALPFVPLPAVILGALVATLADGLTPVVGGYVVDDNASIPLGAAVAMWVGLHLPTLG